MFSGNGQALEQGATTLGRSAGSWPWPVHTRLLLAVFVLIAGVGLRVGVHSAGCDARTASRLVPVLVIDPNTAPASVLEALPHVGPSLVQKLIEQREVRPFVSTDDLRRRVRGLGPATMARLAPYLKIRPTREHSVATEDAVASPVPVTPRLARMPNSLSSR